MFIYKHKKTTLCDLSVSCNVMLQAVEASRDFVVKSDALWHSIFAYQSSWDTFNARL